MPKKLEFRPRRLRGKKRTQTTPDIVKHKSRIRKIDRQLAFEIKTIKNSLRG
ncbi:hypothetical protein [Methylocystis sp.]|uniref:hypothetical protein n=1 Tax=Methylocystis sp. TaxID=1911079 RepID=UPI003DA40122